MQTLKTLVLDLFTLYLGGAKPKNDDSTPQAGKQIIPASRLRAPKDEQFAVDFMQLQNHCQDQEQLRIVTESILASLFVNCSSHMIQVEFLLFALQALLKMHLVNWDSFLPSLLRAASTADPPGGQPGHGQSISTISAGSVAGNASFPIVMSSASSVPQVSTPASPSPSSNLVASPPLSAIDPSGNQLPMKGPDISPNLHMPGMKVSSQGDKVITWLRQLVCKIVLIACEGDLKPVTSLEILHQMVQWIHTWDWLQQIGSEDKKPFKVKRSEQESTSWLYSCLEVVRTLIDENKCRLPFYALLHDRTQLQVEHWPDDEVLFALFLDIHRRRDKISLYMQMFDQHLQCPTFATQRMLSLTYAGVMGEPLHGEDIAASVQKGSIEWERALRCLKHGLHVVPSSDWWRRVLILAPRYRQPSQHQTSTAKPGYFVASLPGYVFTAEMTCEAVVDRIMELMQPIASTVNSSGTIVAENVRWQEWLIFADLFFFFVRNGYLDFLEFVEMLAGRFAISEQQVIRSNHVTWLLAQVFRLETVTSAITTDSKKGETIKKILSFHKEEKPTEQSGNQTPQSLLLDFVGSGQILRLWSINRAMLDRLAGNQVPEHLQKGRQIDEWWRQVGKGERILDYSNLDDKSMGMIWAVSHTFSQPVCDALMAWMKSNGVAEMIVGGNVNQPTERLAVVHETRPLPMTLLSGLSLHLCMRLINQIEELIFSAQMVPSIAMMETYVRLLLIAPHTLFRQHLTGMMQKYQTGAGKPSITLLLLELLNYRLIPLYRYQGKVKQLLYDIGKIVFTAKAKRGDHRLLRLAENLCLNLILSLREVMLVKKELVKGATIEFTETLNRVIVVNLAFTIKTRGIAEFEQLVILQPAIEQILANSPHTWSEKTMRYFPPLLRDALGSRPDKRSQNIQGWHQAEGTVMQQCHQLLSPTADPSYVVTYINRSYPQHRQYLCAGAWMLMDGHPESINTGNLARILKELSPEEVTTNVYTMVDVLLYNIQMQLQHGHALQDLLLRASAGLTLFIWNQEVLPFDIVLLALADRDDDPHALRLVVGLLLDRPEFQQRAQNYCRNHGQQEHFMNSGPFHRPDPQEALGSHLMGKDWFPLFFDEMSVRALPLIPLIVYRLIENDATETAEKLLAVFSPLLVYHYPARLSFVRDTLAYFHGHLPNKLVMRILSCLDLTKIPFSEAFVQHVGSANCGIHFTSDYFTNLLLNLVNNVIPPVSSSPVENISSRAGRVHTAISTMPYNTPENSMAFYRYQDPGTYAQLILETVVIEVLSLPLSPNQIVSTLIHIAVRVQASYVQNYGLAHSYPLSSQSGSTGHVQNMTAGNPRSPILPTSPSAANVDSIASNVGSVSSLAAAPNVGCTTNVSSPSVASSLIIQACGLLLAQLPTPFHGPLYAEAVGIFKKCWWMTDPKRLHPELDAAYGYSAWDPSWAAQDDTSTVIGNTVALLHAFASNLPFEWLEGLHTVITQQRPITTIAHLRLSFRIIGPLLPRLVISRPLFAKTLALLFTILADVFGRNSQIPPSNDVSDLVDFLHHAVMFEVQGQVNGKPKPETLILCSKAVERLHPDLQHLFRHLTIDPISSIYAATHPKLLQKPPSPLMNVM